MATRRPLAKDPAQARSISRPHRPDNRRQRQGVTLQHGNAPHPDLQSRTLANSGHSRPGADGTVQGVVSIASAVTPIDATVSAKHVLVGTGRTVEIANTSADTETGGYTLTLPAAAPNVAAYSTSQSYTFVADPVAGQYTLTATTGGSERTASIALAAGQTVTTNFSFP